MCKRKQPVSFLPSFTLLLNEIGLDPLALLKIIHLMNKLVAAFAAFLLVAFYSCDGQTSSDHAENQQTSFEIGKPTDQLPKGITAIFQDAAGNHWFGSDGVYKYDGNELTHFVKEDGLCGLSVLGIQEDQFGNLFFDTTEGICMFDGSSFTTLEITETTDQDAWQLNSTDLWFRMGWDRGGPLRYDGQQLFGLTFPTTKQEEVFRATYPNVSYNPYGIYWIYKDQGGYMWFGTSSLGLCRFDGSTVQWLCEEQLTTTPDGGSFGIRSMIQDRNHDFWICNTKYRFEIKDPSTESNLVQYERHEGVGELDGHNPKDPLYFMSIVEDGNGDLWMISYDDGVSRFTGSEYIHYPIENGGKEVNLFTMHLDNEGVLWLGSHNAGAWRFNGEEFEQFYVN